jgi:hypothetical protein
VRYAQRGFCTNDCETRYSKRPRFGSR